MKIIKARMKGKEPDLEIPVEPRQAEVVDLMERLRQSLQKAPASRKTRSRGKTTKVAKAGKPKKRRAA
jgi:non-homologous end joining protein Ku